MKYDLHSADGMKHESISYEQLKLIETMNRLLEINYKVIYQDGSIVKVTCE